MDEIPRFYLYGEPHRSAADGFVHLEPLVDRSRPAGWTIQPHSHAELAQLLLVEGGGTVRFEDAHHRFAGAALILVPARLVHGFAWTENSGGFVVTLAGSFLDRLVARDRDLSGLFDRPAVLALPPEEAEHMGRLLAELRRELGWAAPGHRAAVEAVLLAILVGARRQAALAGAEAPRGRQAELVARLRARLEDRYRRREAVRFHADALGVSESALRAACARVAGRSPAAMLDERALLEAKRLLLYSNLSVAEIGYALGFTDPAYFSRFFARHATLSPARFRQHAQRS
jgi:AraC family transcriptional activator of pobA